MESFFISAERGYLAATSSLGCWNERNTAKVTIYDNMSSGRNWHFETIARIGDLPGDG